MAVTRISDELAQEVADSLWGPTWMHESLIPSGGRTVEYNNARYLIAYREGKWLGWDISVYDDEGDLLTGPVDVYVNAVGDAIEESVPVVIDVGKVLIVIGLALAAGWVIYGGKKREAA